jgi:hypothetical protein
VGREKWEEKVYFIITPCPHKMVEPVLKIILI